MGKRILLVVALLLCTMLMSTCCGAVTLNYLSSLSLPSYAFDVYVSGNYAYVATYTSLHVVDITTPSQPKQVGVCAVAEAENVWVQGNYAYVASAAGLTIVDVTTRTAPKVKSTYSPGYGKVLRVCASGNYAYLQYFDNNAVYYIAVNVTNPAAPQASGSCSDGLESSGYGSGLAIYGTSLYGANRTLSKIDVTNPLTMIQTDAGSTGYAESDIFINDAYLYTAGYFDSFPPPPYSINKSLAASDSGLYLKIKDHDGVEYSYYEIPDAGTLRRLCVSGKYAYVSYSTGVAMVDVSDAFDPVAGAKCVTNGTAEGLAVSGEYVYVADGTGGLSVLKSAGTTTSVALVITPETWEYANKPIELVAFGFNGKSPQYQFRSGSTVLRDFSTVGNFVWNPATAGIYSLTVVAKDASGITYTSPVQSYEVISVVKSVSLAASPVSPRPLGTTIKLTATAVGGAGLQYSFYDGAVKIPRYNDSLNTLDWTPTTAGVHPLTVWAVDDSGAIAKSGVLNYTIGASVQSVSLAATPASPQCANKPLTFTATAVGGTGIQYKFLAGGTYVLRDYAASNTMSWTFATAGTRQITVVAKDSNGKTVTSDVLEYVVAPAVKSVTLEASPVSPQYAGKPTTFTATSVDGLGVQYKFLSGGTYVIRDFAASNTAQFTYATAGTRQVTVVAKDSAGNTITSAPLSYNVVSTVQSASVTASPASPQYMGTPLTFTAASVGGLGVQYKFLAGGSYVLRDFAASNTMNWTFETAGTRKITVVAKDSSGKTVTSPILEFVVTGVVQSVGLSVSPASPQLAGTPLTLTALASGGRGLQYKFIANGTYVLRDFASSNTMNWTFATAGIRTLSVVAKDDTGKTVTSPSSSYTILPSVQSVSLAATPVSPKAGTLTTLTATAVGGEGVQYKFIANGTYVLRDYASSNTMTWTFATAGTRTLTVIAKDSNGKIVTSAPVTYIVSPALSVTLQVSPASPQIAGTQLTLTANASGGEGITYKFIANGTYVLRDFASSNTMTWTFATAGTRPLTVVAKDSTGKTVTSAVLNYVVTAP